MKYLKHLVITAIFVVLATVASAKIRNGSPVGTDQHARTDQLMQEVEATMAAEYAHIDGLSTDVFVLAVPENKIPGLNGVTNLTSSCVYVRVRDFTGAGRYLAHEMGHAQYFIEHPEYKEINREQYAGREGQHGHDPMDPSGQLAEQYEKQFCKAQKAIRKAGKNA